MCGHMDKPAVVCGRISSHMQWLHWSCGCHQPRTFSCICPLCQFTTCAGFVQRWATAQQVEASAAGEECGNPLSAAALSTAVRASRLTSLDAVAIKALVQAAYLEALERLEGGSGAQPCACWAGGVVKGRSGPDPDEQQLVMVCTASMAW